jgi:hypothetical protein
MNLSPKSVFGSGNGNGSVWGAQPSPVVGTGGYKYQPGTIISTISQSPTVPTFGSSFSPPSVPTIGNLWGATPPTASGNPYTPKLPINTVTPQPVGGGGFWKTFTGALFG